MKYEKMKGFMVLWLRKPKSRSPNAFIETKQKMKQRFCQKPSGTTFISTWSVAFAHQNFGPKHKVLLWLFNLKHNHDIWTSFQVEQLWITFAGEFPRILNVKTQQIHIITTYFNENINGNILGIFWHTLHNTQCYKFSTVWMRKWQRNCSKTSMNKSNWTKMNREQSLCIYYNRNLILFYGRWRERMKPCTAHARVHSRDECVFVEVEENVFGFEHIMYVRVLVVVPSARIHCIF